MEPQPSQPQVCVAEVVRVPVEAQSGSLTTSATSNCSDSSVAPPGNQVGQRSLACTACSHPALRRGGASPSGDEQDPCLSPHLLDTSGFQSSRILLIPMSKIRMNEQDPSIHPTQQRHLERELPFRLASLPNPLQPLLRPCPPQRDLRDSFRLRVLHQLFPRLRPRFEGPFQEVLRCKQPFDEGAEGATGDTRRSR
jgi:hypothetical protein